MALLQAKNVSFSYDKVNSVISGVSLSIEKGEYVAVIGSNELEKGEVNLKRLADGSQTLVKLELLPEYLERA